MEAGKDCVSIEKTPENMALYQGIGMKNCIRFLLLPALLLSNLASAQEGHPYEGTRRGTINMGATTAPMALMMRVIIGMMTKVATMVQS
jgi:hypothetical protein